jgi:hypothetical protein
MLGGKSMAFSSSGSIKSELEFKGNRKEQDGRKCASKSEKGGLKPFGSWSLLPGSLV